MSWDGTSEPPPADSAAIVYQQETPFVRLTVTVARHRAAVAAFSRVTDVTGDLRSTAVRVGGRIAVWRSVAFVRDSFFTVTPTLDGDVFVGTDFARGPWDEHACHAGPPTGMLARASERLVPGQRLTRLWVELGKTIPMPGFRIIGEVTRTGRATSSTSLTIVDLDGNPRVHARGSHIIDRPVMEATIGDRFDTPILADSIPGEFPIRQTGHGKPAFMDGVQLRYPPGEDRSPGPTTVWMHTVPLLADESMSAFQRICPLADCGNAFGRNAEALDVSFVNTDLAVTLHRDPIGEWMGMSAMSVWQPNGVGMSSSVLFDELGAVGQATQTLLLTPIGRT